MEKREFIKVAGIFGAGALVSPLAACGKVGKTAVASHMATAPVFEHYPLPYAHAALEPHIDTLTMEIHHGKHHAAYVKNLNSALEKTEKYNGKSLTAILAEVSADESAIRNNGGGHYNHEMFWKTLTPGGSNTPSGAMASALIRDFGSYEEFEKLFADAAKSRFGSGWAWLSADSEGKLFVSSTPNQDNPLMARLTDKQGKPLIGLDVWEHAYYLHYQNRRPDYVGAFMKVINWDLVAARL